jgi:D-alanine--poly(phosphoribitol) ligase subunit 2
VEKQMPADIENILIEFLRKNCLPQKQEIAFNPEDNLFQSGILDSAGLLHFVGYIETEFKIEIPDEDLIPDKFTSIASIAAYIRTRIGELSTAVTQEK